MCLVSNVFEKLSMDPKAKRKAVLKVKYFKEASLRVTKGALCELVKKQRKVLRGNAPLTVRSVSIETIQQMSEIFVVADING